MAFGVLCFMMIERSVEVELRAETASETGVKVQKDTSLTQISDSRSVAIFAKRGYIPTSRMDDVFLSSDLGIPAIVEDDDGSPNYSLYWTIYSSSARQAASLVFQTLHVSTMISKYWHKYFSAWRPLSRRLYDGVNDTKDMQGLERNWHERGIRNLPLA
ncbi:hypothetical protein LTR78_010109 [Recurvomyces mirabilis]|uniref:Uncharacterized protein n=1 Tax=Recurvomyces mirabilis TaxID=574656 RepID=A0AAE0TND4_9PEZI|nr:hypothetical protein LTR78_010109 [Recurvomyces mirabilis]KAK5150066.1 hypothetical protein LTS14_010431 [Recurvomyces mirabilis]